MRTHEVELDAVPLLIRISMLQPSNELSDGDLAPKMFVFMNYDDLRHEKLSHQVVQKIYLRRISSLVHALSRTWTAFHFPGKVLPVLQVIFTDSISRKRNRDETQVN